MTAEDERQAEAQRLIALWQGREWSWLSRFRDTESELQAALRDGDEKEVVTWLEQIENLYNEPRPDDAYKMRQEAVDGLTEATRRLSEVTKLSQRTILRELWADASRKLDEDEGVRRWRRR